MNQFAEFERLYSRSITLRFGLIPQGRTLEHIEKDQLLKQDEHRAESYQKVKDLIDEYHKRFVTRVLSDFSLKIGNEGKKDSLVEYYRYYDAVNKDQAQKGAFTKIQNNLRAQIAKRLSKDEAFNTMFGKELIEQDLFHSEWMRPLNSEEAVLVKEFHEFTTYFKGFNENRKNMYASKAQSTAIAYRLIHENLPKFVDNIKTFDVVSTTEVAQQFEELHAQMKEYLNVDELKEMFELEYFNKVLTQDQIEVYNAIIGGKSFENGTRIQGLNERINLYNQKHKEQKLPKFKLLFKQILSDRNAISWLPEQFENDNEVLKAINKCYQDLVDEIILGDGNLKNLLQHIGSYKLDQIYITNDTQLTNISQQLFKDWGAIARAILEDLKATTKPKKKEKESDYQDRLENLVKHTDSFSIGYLNACIDKYLPEKKHIETYFAGLGATNTEVEQQTNLFTRIEILYTEAQQLLTSQYPENANLAQADGDVEKIKNLLDAIKELQHFIKPLLGHGDESEKDETFYGEFTSLWDHLNAVTPLYNMVRNYMTRKPYSTEKIKLNFENAKLMDGWDLNKEKANTTVILRKDGLYYLAIMKNNKEGKKVFDATKLPSSVDCYEKMEYKLLKDAYKNLPRVLLLSESRKDEFKPSPTLQKHYTEGTHKKGDNFSLKDCHELIDFFKASIQKHEDWKKFDFHFSDTSTYEDLSGFYREVEQQGYKLTFRNVSVAYVDQLVEEGKVYLFQIYNKDFSSYSKGTPNLHTLYWKMLFDERNLADVVYKLNGEAEIFYRKSSLQKNRPEHPAHQPIQNKNANNPKKESVFTYDLIKDKRYTVDKFQFHVPITMNFKATGSDNINLQVRQYLKEAKDTYVIGIDRGERHLLYLSLIDPKGRIVQQFTLNEIINEYNGVEYKTNYHDLLDTRETERKKARQSWKAIENIKELKEGYMSQVVHKIVELMVKYKAIVVLEDLNFGFKRGRQKVEKQVYQKFETMLIDKLNYLVDKQADVDAQGGLLHAYQLTNKFTSFKELGKQSGFLFYVPAWNTSKMDPTTGFVNLLDTRYETIEKSRSFFNKFSRIAYNDKAGWFEFSFDYNDFHKRAEGTRTKWTICTQGERIITFRNPEKNSEWDNRKVVLTDEFKLFFEKNSIDIHDNLKEQIAEHNDKPFFEELYRLLKLTLQMRNSITSTEEDFLISPVKNADGEFYDSRTCGDTLPTNADANGAYNIACKGLWVLQQLRKTQDLKKAELAISNKEWMQFAQERPYLKD